MISFEYPEQLAMCAEVAHSFVIDCGAFTKWKAGKGEVDESAYVDFVRQWFRHPGFDWCIIPDIIDGDEAANDTLIEGWPLKIEISVPVWHMHESPERLARLCEDFPRVAIGSSGEFADIGTQRWWSRMSEAMEYACDGDGRPFAKLHGLRQMDPTVFSHIPYASVDSTVVARNINLDTRWTGSYQPLTERTRAIVLRERVEHHASAARWTGSSGVQKNLELVG